MERFTERDDLWGNKLVLKSMAETGEHTDPWCISASSPNPITIRGAAVERLAEYEDTSLTPDEILTIDKMYQELGKEVMAYRKIGTLKECREAVEKQKAKKPLRIDMCTCPTCGTYNESIKKRRNTVNQDIVYCWHCGQAMEINRSDVSD